MPQYLVASYLPDDFDPSSVTEAMVEKIHALNRELIAAGVRKFACGISPASNAKTCGSRLMARCSSPMGHSPRPRSTWAVSGYWKPLIWTRHSRGRARVPSPAMRWARCASFFSTRLRNKDPAKASKQPFTWLVPPKPPKQIDGWPAKHQRWPCADRQEITSWMTCRWLTINQLLGSLTWTVPVYQR